jgi:hypothetical protein
VQYDVKHAFDGAEALLCHAHANGPENLDFENHSMIYRGAPEDFLERNPSRLFGYGHRPSRPIVRVVYDGAGARMADPHDPVSGAVALRGEGAAAREAAKHATPSPDDVTSVPKERGIDGVGELVPLLPGSAQ